MAKFGVMLEVEINDDYAVPDIIAYLLKHKAVDTAALNEGPDELEVNEDIDGDDDDDDDDEDDILV